MKPSLWGILRALAGCMKDQSHKGPKLRGLGGWCPTREVWMKEWWTRRPCSWKGRDGHEGQLEWFSKIWQMTENEGRWRRSKYVRVLELDQEGWSNVVTTVHGLWQLKKPLHTVLKLTWQACGAHVGPGCVLHPRSFWEHLLHLWPTQTMSSLDAYGWGFTYTGVGRWVSSASTSERILYLAHGRMRIHPYYFTTRNILPSVCLESPTSTLMKMTVYTRTAGVSSRD